MMIRKKAMVGFWLGLMLLSSPAAGPLESGHVAEDAKWLIHFDAENFRKTQVGKFVFDTLLTKHREELRAHLKAELGFDMDIEGILSMTAYGTGYGHPPSTDGVVLIRLSDSMHLEIKSLLSRQSKMADTSDLPILAIKSDLDHLYSIDGEVYVNPRSNGIVLWGASQKSLEEANRLIDRDSTEGDGHVLVEDYPELPDTLIFMAVAEDFSEHASVPPQAKVFQQSKGGRVAIGETDENLFVRVALKTPAKHVGDQIKDVVKGLLAIVMLGIDDPKIVELARAVKVDSKENLVWLHLELPVKRAMNLLQEVKEEEFDD